MNICALATGRGGAIAIIRVSGPDAITIVNSLFLSASGKSLLGAQGQTLHYGQLLSSSTSKPLCPAAPSQVIDDVLLSLFRAPHSYTGENAAEISCHASPYIIQSILHALCQAGCRMATPGEFTQRAFLNGKLDLSQAEAVADLIASTNAATHRMAMSQLRGNFSTELSLLRDRLLHLTSLMELELDFADHEELEFADRTQLLALAREIDQRITRLIDSFRTGRALKQGIPVAIVGKTNVGKSTLLNRLVGEERAIVSDIHGTTRDTIEDTVTLRGVTFRFIDTAGLRETTDEIENLGIERTKQKIQEAAIILHLSDNLEDLQQEPPFSAITSPSSDRLPPSPIPSQSLQKVLPVLTKIDQQRTVLGDSFAESIDGLLPISAKTGEGLPALEAALLRAADIPEIHANDTIVTNARHHASLLAAHAALTRVLQGLTDGIPTDLLAEDLRETLHHLGEITGGAITSQEVLNNIWSHFCIGK